MLFRSHGYSNEGIYQMTEEQETHVLEKCIDVATKLVGKRARGYRAPMYTIRETTVKLLREHGFLYDTSLMHHDSQPYWTPADPPIQTIDFSKDASSWLQPTPITAQAELNPLKSGDHPLVEIPCGWYNEDMMPLQYLPHLPNSMGYVSTRVVEQMWKDKFMWLWENAAATEKSFDTADFIFPILAMMSRTGDGVDGPRLRRQGGFLLLFLEAVRQVLNRLLGVQAVQVNVHFLIGGERLVALLVERAGGFAVLLPHERVLVLSAKRESFGAARVVTIPCLRC